MEEKQVHEASVDSKPLFELEPKNELTFKGRLDHVGSVWLYIKNRDLCNIYFKVKSTASSFYSVRPNTGVIGPYGRVKVIIHPNDNSLTKLDEIEAEKHKFLVMSAVVADLSVEADKFWKGKKERSEGVYATKLKTKIASPEPLKNLSKQNGKFSLPKPEHNTPKQSLDTMLYQNSKKMASPEPAKNLSEQNGKVASPKQDTPEQSLDTMLYQNLKKVASPEQVKNVLKQNGKFSLPEPEQNTPKQSLDTMLYQNSKMASPEPAKNLSEQNGKVALPKSEQNTPKQSLDTVPDQNSKKTSSPEPAKYLSEPNGKVASPEPEQNTPKQSLDTVPDQNSKKTSSPEPAKDLPQQNGKVASPEQSLDTVSDQNSKKMASLEPAKKLSEQNGKVASPEQDTPKQSLDIVLDQNSEITFCDMESNRFNSPVNHLFAQYCAEMVEMLLEKMPEKDGFQLRKELNEVLTKYEAGLIG